MTEDNWTDRFLGLSRLDPPVRARLHRDGRIVRFSKGQEIFGPGREPDSLLFLLDGTVRVFQTSDSGREIVLYRVEAGQSCVMTTACLLADEAYSAEGVAETDVTAVALPKATFDAMIADVPAFRDFVFAAYSHRMLDLFRIIEEVAFGRVDVRLAARLVGLAGQGDDLKITHQALATELGTAREVVSRQLTEFQRRGWIEQTRGAIHFADRAALEDLAQSA